MIARAKALLAATLLVAGAAACSDVTGNVNPEGQFFLMTVNGTHVPYSYTDGNGNNIYVQSDTYVLSTDGAYSETQVYQLNGATQFLREDGTYTQSGNTVYFNPTQSDFSLTPYQGIVRNSSSFGGSRTLTISLNGSTAVYSD